MIITVTKSIRINENINLWLVTWFLGLMILNSVRLVSSNGNGQLHYGRFPNALEITKPFCKYVFKYSNMDNGKDDKYPMIIVN